ncbi:unnamed protein product [Amoebophrya sp. A120]|nr:unnamed protein product [Amoebophrya sp. A120]|eukprot:GSA120T00022218001.1
MSSSLQENKMLRVVLHQFHLVATSSKEWRPRLRLMIALLFLRALPQRPLRQRKRSPPGCQPLPRQRPPTSWARSRRFRWEVLRRPKVTRQECRDQHRVVPRNVVRSEP